jgi:hypothetical protein
LPDRIHAVSRRSFVAGSAALSAAPLLPAWMRAAAGPSPALFLCDAGCAPPPGAAGIVLHFDGDLTAPWRDRIDPLFREGDAAIAGITRPSALFCLELLAGGRRRRVIERTLLASGHVRWTIAPVGSEAWI